MTTNGRQTVERCEKCQQGEVVRTIREIGPNRIQNSSWTECPECGHRREGEDARPEGMQFDSGRQWAAR